MKTYTHVAESYNVTRLSVTSYISTTSAPHSRVCVIFFFASLLRNSCEFCVNRSHCIPLCCATVFCVISELPWSLSWDYYSVSDLLLPQPVRIILVLLLFKFFIHHLNEHTYIFFIISPFIFKSTGFSGNPISLALPP